MKTNIEPLLPNTFYHIYNRGNNGETIFKEVRNYPYFLQKYGQYIQPVADTYAYCLLSNHFHMLIKTRSEDEVRKAISMDDFKDVFAPSEDILKYRHHDKSISWIFGNEFSSLFKSYAQAINKAHKRTGKLFEEPFRRIVVDTEAYFTQLIYYIHFNPQKHGFVKDFRDYPYSSYHSHLSKSKTKLRREDVIKWFGNEAEYEKFHLKNISFDEADDFIIEFD